MIQINQRFKFPSFLEVENILKDELEHDRIIRELNKNS